MTALCLMAVHLRVCCVVLQYAYTCILLLLLFSSLVVDGKQDKCVVSFIDEKSRTQLEHCDQPPGIYSGQRKKPCTGKDYITLLNCWVD